MKEQKNRISTFPTPSGCELPKVYGSKNEVNNSKKKSSHINLLRGYDNSHRSIRNKYTRSRIQGLNKEEFFHGIEKTI